MHRKIIKAPHRLLIRFSALWKRRFGVLPLRESIADVTAWFDSPLGQSLLAEEQEAINDGLQYVFGYHLLQLGISGRVDLSSQSLISHRFLLHPHTELNPRLSGVVDFNHLPLPAESIDAVVLHHTLDYSQSPHHLLREATRVLIPRGHLIIIGFNPWSLWGFCARIARLITSVPRWRFQYLRLGRLLDWLALVDMEPIAIYKGFFRPPLPQENAIKHLQWVERWGKRLRLPWGGFYMIVARKDHIPLTPIKPAWQKYRPLRGLAVTRILGPTSGASIRSLLFVDGQV
ncbi:methyltransferase domain-containing protein [Cellvibrio mixtus]|uniref:methyltransferase domain-containing protein n=1 Tax=Cellvibrio mixtus TaxID=39650 RepID=UPI0006935921|nr:methyltransferase domain-containing protein [Cellvibrio mixtus]